MVEQAMCRDGEIEALAQEISWGRGGFEAGKKDSTGGSGPIQESEAPQMPESTLIGSSEGDRFSMESTKAMKTPPTATRTREAG